MCLTLKTNLKESLTFDPSNSNTKTIKVYKQYLRSDIRPSANGFPVRCLHRVHSPILKKDVTLVSSREVNPTFNGFENRLSPYELRRNEVHEGFHAWRRKDRALNNGYDKKKAARCSPNSIIVEFEGHIDHFIAEGTSGDMVFSRLTPKAIVGYSTRNSSLLRKPTKAMLKAFNGSATKKKT